MEVAQQLGAARDVALRHGFALLLDVLFEGGDLVRRDLLHKGAGHFGFEHAAHGKDLLRFFDRRGSHKSAACGFQPNQAVLRQLKQRLAHQRARYAEVVGQLLFGQFGAGQEPMLHDGAGERFDDVVRGGGFHVSRSLGALGPGVFM